MERLLFSKDALVEIQGNEVIQLNSLNKDHATYQVIGFDNPCIYIEDYRQENIEDIKLAVETNNVNDFAERFNTLSKVAVIRDPQKIIIELHQPSTSVGRFRLWITSEIGERIPLYRYRLFKSSPVSDGKYRLLSIYKRPYQKGKHQPAPFSSE